MDEYPAATFPLLMIVNEFCVHHLEIVLFKETGCELWNSIFCESIACSEFHMRLCSELRFLESHLSYLVAFQALASGSQTRLSG
jgi:hypothetical protein